MCYFVIIEPVSKINWEALSTIATILTTIIAFIALYDTKKEIKQNLQISLLDKKLRYYSSIVGKYFKIFQQAETILGKCNSLKNGNKNELKSIMNLLDTTFKDACIHIAAGNYSKIYVLSVFGDNVTNILNNIDDICLKLDREPKRNISDILNIIPLLEDLIKQKNKLSSTLALSMGINVKEFNKYFNDDYNIT